MSYDRKCSTYWCDKCRGLCDIDWHKSGDIYFVLKCVKCDWKRIYVDLDDVTRRYGYKKSDLAQGNKRNILETEVEYFEQHRKEWCKHHLGKVAVISGTTLCGFYDTYETALEVGYGKCGIDQPFLVKEVCIKDEVLLITRFLGF